MRVLIACEYSGTVRRAFRERGHEAFSCDILAAEDNSPHHFQADCLEILDLLPWDLLIAHPPCTHLAVSGARYFPDKQMDGRQDEALAFVIRLMVRGRRIGKYCIENPVSIIASQIRKPDQVIQPYHFGDAARKTTCLWLHGLPLLRPANVVEPELVHAGDGKTYSKFHYETFRLPKEIRWKERSRTYEGIAKAMAQQWG